MLELGWLVISILFLCLSFVRQLDLYMNFFYVGEPINDESGELVCLKPFPSMPTHFWNDPDGIKYHKAYFAMFQGKILVLQLVITNFKCYIII